MEVPIRPPGRQGACILPVDAVLARVRAIRGQVSDDGADPVCSGHARRIQARGSDRGLSSILPVAGEATAGVVEETTETGMV